MCVWYGGYGPLGLIQVSLAKSLSLKTLANELNILNFSSAVCQWLLVKCLCSRIQPCCIATSHYYLYCRMLRFCLQPGPNVQGEVAPHGDMRWATWWTASAVSSPMTLLLLPWFCYVAGSETVWQGMRQLVFFWGQGCMMFGKEAWCGWVTFPSSLSSSPHLYHHSCWIRWKDQETQSCNTKLNMM